MARTSTEAVPAKDETTERRSDWFHAATDPGVDPEITFHRVKRVDGNVEAQTDVKRKLSAVANEPFGNIPGVTIGMAAQAIADIGDRWAIEDKEP